MDAPTTITIVFKNGVKIIKKVILDEATKSEFFNEFTKCVGKGVTGNIYTSGMIIDVGELVYVEFD